MKSNKPTQKDTQKPTNLIGNETHREFLDIRASYGFAQSGGSVFSQLSKSHQNRLVNDVNKLTTQEKKQLIFSLPIFSN